MNGTENNSPEIQEAPRNEPANGNIPQNEPPKTLGDRLFSLFMTATIICAVTAAVFVLIDKRVSAFLAGILFTVFGFIAIAKIKISYKTWEIILLPVIGLPMIGISAYLLLSERFPEGIPPVTPEMTVLFWGILAFVMGLGMIVITVFTRSGEKKRCTLEVNAVCVDYIRMQSRGFVFFRPVWEYTVNGQVCHGIDKASSIKKKPERGHEQTVMVNPDDTEDFYRSNATGHIMFIIMGACLIFAGCLILGLL